ncbi:MAG: M3 family metallopeptidase [Myxococcaceae bacterium]
MRRFILTACLSVLAGCTGAKAVPPPEKVTTVPKPIPPPNGAALLTGTAEAFTKSCTDDLAQARALVTELKTQNGKADAAGVLEKYDRITALSQNVGARSSVARNAHPDAGMREAAEKCEQETEKFNTELSLDRGVYDVVAQVDLSAQNDATKTWVTRSLRDMRRLGVDKDEATRTKVKALSEELTVIGQEFGRNIVQDVKTVELDPKQLNGLPEDFIKAHAPRKNGKVSVNTDYPDYVPFLTYAKDSKAREQLWRAYRQRAYPKNVEVLNNLISKRNELATLLGYPNWAAYITETKMIGSAQKAAEFIDSVNAAAKPAAEREMAALLELKKKDDPKAKELLPWDQDFYEDKYKAQQFGFDSQAARPYFEYTRVLAGVLDVTSGMFGIKYTPVDVKTWHPDVRVFDVSDETGLRGRIYLDMHPRADKYKHAAQFDLVTGQTGIAYAEGVLMCNFPKPPQAGDGKDGQPALMQPREVETFFHEFGHLLHHVLGGHQRWAAQSGVKTEWDFVEAPSMMLQEWAQNGDALAKFAKHYQTGEAIPAELVKKMVAAKEFGKGLYTRRQMFLSAVSLNYYNRAPGFDTMKLASELQTKFLPFRREMEDGTYFPLSFGHLEGYSAIYYTYIWSSVIARDLLTVFEKEGYLNPVPATRYRKAILEQGGSKDAELLVKDFLGREHSFDAYAKWLNTAPAKQ